MEKSNGQLMAEVNEAAEPIIATSLQVGLKLPDGRTIFPPDEYKGYPIARPQERAYLLEVLKKSAGDLSFTTEAFLRHYGWVTRELTTTTVIGHTREIPITDDLAFAEVTDRIDHGDQQDGHPEGGDA